MPKKVRGKGKMGPLASVLTSGGSQVSDNQGSHRGPKTVRTSTNAFRGKKMGKGM